MSQLHPIQHGTCFITTNVYHRRQLFASDVHAREAIDVLYSVQKRYLFHIFAFVIMPDHAHFLLGVPDGGSISKIMNVYKGIVSANIGVGPIWQRGFFLQTDVNVEKVRRYIHHNPIQAGLCDVAKDYPWSSASGRWDVSPIMPT